MITRMHVNMNTSDSHFISAESEEAPKAEE